jgi:hypothetical protein
MVAQKGYTVFALNNNWMDASAIRSRQSPDDAAARRSPLAARRSPLSGYPIISGNTS